MSNEILAQKNFVIYRKENRTPQDARGFITHTNDQDVNVVVSVGSECKNIQVGNSIICGRYGEVTLHVPGQELYAVKEDDVVAILK